MKPVFGIFIFLSLFTLELKNANAQLAVQTAKRTPKTGKANIELLGFRVLKADSSVQQPVSLSLNAYLDVYYGFNFSQPESKDNPYFYASHRHNEFNVNLAYLSVGVSHEKFRARFTPGWGTYMAANYAAEPAMMRNIYEASVGVKIVNKLWLDAGVLPSPYGYETAVSKDQQTYTRSFSAENSPYYVTGAKLTYTLNPTFTVSAFALNGWQKIQQPMRSPAFGTQVQAQPNDKWLANWTTYFGDQTATKGEAASWRLFSNQYVSFSPNNKLHFVALLDVGAQNIIQSAKAQKWRVWHTAHLIVSYRPIEKAGFSVRGEYYSDPYSVMISPITANLKVEGFRVYSASVTLDYAPISNVKVRLEGRGLFGDRNVFFNSEGELAKNSFMLIANISAAF